MPLTLQHDLHLLETLGRVLDKGIVIDAWVRDGLSGIELIGCTVCLVAPTNGDDDGGGGGRSPAQQMRVAR